MDLLVRKYRLIEKLLKVEQEIILSQLEKIILSGHIDDFDNELSSELEQLLDKGIGQSKNGFIKTNEEIIVKVKRNYYIE